MQGLNLELKKGEKKKNRTTLHMAPTSWRTVIQSESLAIQQRQSMVIQLPINSLGRS